MAYSKEARRAHYVKNGDKIRAYHREWHKRKGALHRKDHYIKCVYGLSLEDYRRMAAQQNDRCAICDTTPKTPKGRLFPLYVDHDHATGAVRALLCNRCNAALGFLEDTSWVSRAQAYLHEHAS